MSLIANPESFSPEPEGAVIQTIHDEPWVFVIYVVCLVIVPLIISVFANYLLQKRADLHGYSRNRSEYVTQARFDKEINCIQELSKELLLLIQATKACRTSTQYGLEISWKSQHERALSALGRSAPFLNYLDLENDSVPYCGVASVTNFSKHADENKSSESSMKESENYKKCSCKIEEGASTTNPSEQLVLNNELYVIPVTTKEASTYPKNLYMRACEILRYCEVAYATSDFACRQKKPYYKGPSSPQEFNTYLDCRYQRFINCAYCRLNIIEYGRKSIRRNNKKATHRKDIPPLRKLEEHNAKFDQACPYESLLQQEASDKSGKNNNV